MTASTWFDDLPVVGKWPPARAAAKLRELGEDDAAATLEAAQRELRRGPETFGWLERLWPFGDKPWRHTAHAFGYIAPSRPSGGPLLIQHAGNIPPDPVLKSSRIRITLDRFRVATYPGGGTHRVLFDFYAQNQVGKNIEHLHFNATYRVREGEQAAIIGYPIFLGLNVGVEGVAFKCFTVNVKNDEDEAFLGFLESDVFKAGLRLASTVQPAIAPLSQMALGLTKSIAVRHRNVPVQDFYMGLDFSTIPTRARLAEGAYLAVQIPETLETVWDWSEWLYNPASGQVVNKDDNKRLIPYNYVVFSVSRYEGA
ncbi:hypothetical protein MYX77_00920 [Acidobacteriia bacterium AH_259_A11_L15]|nr:hypothetical protein [Acidobacteriia bacterium AH_259_A11_L15]